MSGADVCWLSVVRSFVPCCFVSGGAGDHVFNVYIKIFLFAPIGANAVWGPG